jgi:hypothetical protein
MVFGLSSSNRESFGVTSDHLPSADNLAQKEESGT